MERLLSGEASRSPRRRTREGARRAGRVFAPLVLAAALAQASADARAESDRNVWSLELELSAPNASTGLTAWTDGGISKLRYDESDGAATASRLVAEYRGRLAPTLFAHVVADWVDDASSGLDLTEAYLDWRPIPKSRLRQRVRIGAFYPPLSLDNGGPGWSSPSTISSSAINTWLGEEIRPLGAEWSARRTLGAPGAPQEIGVFAAGFYGNDPAGTLLFWRGWALHDRQSRFGDRFTLPPIVLFRNGAVVGLVDNRFEPFHEVDGVPGVYAGAEWRYARRALLQIAVYDNRADPEHYSQQWGWRTRFTHAAAQLSLPSRFGLVAQRLDGKTRWETGGLPDGTRVTWMPLASDDFDSWYALLTRPIFARHSVALRFDDFEIARPGSRFVSDDGNAWTVAYRYEPSARFGVALEWMRIDSSRMTWPSYGAPRSARERQLELKFDLAAGNALPR
ncbi:MAG TPA: hypothetical protein VFV10_04630 [Gammaproteobacteria bacterium]|nr:hypothetical protein [Gammaproteobacteria bacterium]